VIINQNLRLVPFLTDQLINWEAEQRQQYCHVWKLGDRAVDTAHGIYLPTTDWTADCLETVFLLGVAWKNVPPTGSEA